MENKHSYHNSNILYHGDCLNIDIEPKSIDLIYLDPPFNSGRDYVVKDSSNRVSSFSDIWKFDEESKLSLENFSKMIKNDSFCLWLKSLSDSSLTAYLIYMGERLLVMKSLLKPTGSIYLHCDQTASHYLKILMDVIFGQENYINEIIWSYRTGGASKRWFSKKHDTIFLYSASHNGKYTFNPIKDKSYTKSASRKPGVMNYGGGDAEFFEDENGVYNWVNMRDVWDISYLNSQSKERLGYPTQKPLTLLERIISASSNEDDIILDPFCGSGTTIEAAHLLNRRWIGIDISIDAIDKVSQDRLRDKMGLNEDIDFIIKKN